jgi:hypothetical protein
MGKRWTAKELNFLMCNSSKIPINKLALKLNKTEKAVRSKVSLLKLHLIDKRLKPTLNVGTTFGLLKIIGTIIKHVSERKLLYYICECKCGRTKEIPKSNLINGSSTSCGCSGIIKKILPNGESTFIQKYAICRSAANKRGLIFEITLEQYKNIITQDCFYCGSPPKPYSRLFKTDGTKTSNLKLNVLPKKAQEESWVNINTIDRVDSKKGYIVENCVASCWPCNEMKMDRSESCFVSHVYKIVVFQESKKQK